MTNNLIVDCREAFEVWYMKEYPQASFTRHKLYPDLYLWEHAQVCWNAWQAAWELQDAIVKGGGNGMSYHDTNSLSREIPLTKGYVTIVDASDYDFLMQWKWQARPNDGGLCYAIRSQHIPLPTGRILKPVQMHKVLMPPPAGYEIDHINGNGLDNRKANLRVCKHQHNMWNRKAVTGSKSKYKGVDWYAASGSWRAYIKIDGKQKHLGCYKNEDDAARAYNNAAIELHGAFARLNPVEGDPAPRITHPYQHEWHKRKQEAHA